MLPEKGGEVIAPHPDFRIIATAYTIGNGDKSGLYDGATILNKALMDRFITVSYLDYPDEKTEDEILLFFGNCFLFGKEEISSEKQRSKITRVFILFVQAGFSTENLEDKTYLKLK